MKKFLILGFALLAASSAFAKKVKFAVNMTGQAINATGVHVTGDFQAVAGFPGGDWLPNTTQLFPEVSDTNVYSVVVDVPAFTKYEFKFLNGDQTYDVEFVPVESRVLYNFDDNRWIYVDSLANDTLLVGPVMFGGNAPIGKYLLRFRVDMSNEAAIDPAGVHVAGAFQNWDPATTQLYSFDGAMYEYITYVDTGMNSFVHEFKYTNGNTSAGYETIPSTCAINSNRGTTVPKDTMLESVCFSACVNCLSIGISEQNSSGNIRLFPNPTSEDAMIEFNDGKAVHNVTITDASGRVVRSYNNYSSAYLRVNRESLASGMYFALIDGGTTSAVSIKWVLE